MAKANWNEIELAFANDNLTTNQIADAFETKYGLTYDRILRERRAWRSAHGLAPLPKGPRSKAPALVPLSSADSVAPIELVLRLHEDDKVWLERMIEQLLNR